MFDHIVFEAGSGTSWYGNVLDTNGHVVVVNGDRKPVSAPVVFRANALVGSFCTVLPGVTLGEGCLVAAGSVVTKDVPPHSLAGGNPARVLSEDVDGPTQLIDRSVFGWNGTRRGFVNVEPVDDRRRVLLGTPAADATSGTSVSSYNDIQLGRVRSPLEAFAGDPPRRGLHAGQPRRISEQALEGRLEAGRVRRDERDVVRTRTGTPRSRARPWRRREARRPWPPA